MPASDRPPAAPSVAPVVRCHGLVVDYRTAAGVAPALRGIDISCHRRRLTVVAGPSGSGKSTFLRVLAGLLRPRAGVVTIDGVDVTRLRAGPLRRVRRRSMGIVLQNPSDNLVEYLTAVQQVELAAKLRGVQGADPNALLEALGLAPRLAAHPAELSGGEQQRVAFAAAAIGSPTVLLADEPTAQLDAEGGAAVVRTMRDLAELGATLIVTSHDASVIDAADDLVMLRDGAVVQS